MTSEFRDFTGITQARLTLITYRSVVRRNIAIQAAILEKPRKVCPSVLHEKPTSPSSTRQALRGNGRTSRARAESNIAECANERASGSFPLFSLSTTPYWHSVLCDSSRVICRADVSARAPSCVGCTGPPLSRGLWNKKKETLFFHYPPLWVSCAPGMQNSRQRQATAQRERSVLRSRAWSTACATFAREYGMEYKLGPNMPWRDDASM